MMKNEYTAPELEIIEFSEEDIIATSPVTDDASLPIIK